MQRIYIASGIAVLSMLFVPGCSGNSSSPSTPSTPTAPTISSIAVSGAAPNVGATAQFTATAALSNNTTQTVTSQATWQSSNTAVASVTSSGVVTGVSAGTADVTATYQSVTGTAHLTISRPTTAVFTINGTVTDGTSHGILPNIAISTVDSAAVTRRATTNDSGNYFITGVASGVVVVTASAVSYQTITQAVTVTANTRLDIVLPRASSLVAGAAIRP
jgi:hypothetical protein